MHWCFSYEMYRPGFIVKILLNYQLQNVVRKANSATFKGFYNWPPFVKVVYTTNGDSRKKKQTSFSKATMSHHAIMTRFTQYCCVTLSYVTLYFHELVASPNPLNWSLVNLDPEANLLVTPWQPRSCTLHDFCTASKGLRNKTIKSTPAIRGLRELNLRENTPYSRIPNKPISSWPQT